MSNRKNGSLKIKVSSLSERAVTIAAKFAEDHGISFGSAVNRLLVQPEKQRLAADATRQGHTDLRDSQAHQT